MDGGLVGFFSLTLIVSWTLWAAAATIPSGTLRALLFLLGTIAPALVAAALAARVAGRAGVRELLRGTLRWPATARWYVFAIGYMAAVKLGVAVLYRVAMGAWPALGESPIYVMILGIAVSTPVQAGEEIGWRGFALPRLASRFGLPGASLVLGIFWGCWHLPFFFIPGSDNAGQSFPLYVLAVTALSVTMAWLYWRTHGSLGITMLMHAAINNSAGIVQPQVSATMNPLVRMPSLTAWLTALLLWVGAAYGLVKMRGASLDRA